MALLTEDREATVAPAKTRVAIKTETPTKKAASPVPVGAPNQPQIESTLHVLRLRLQGQIDGLNGHDTPEMREVRNSVRSRLEQVNAALMRIEEGKYGLCVDCASPIEPDRLVVRPFATRCGVCESHRERR